MEHLEIFCLFSYLSIPIRLISVQFLAMNHWLYLGLYFLELRDFHSCFKSKLFVCFHHLYLFKALKAPVLHFWSPLQYPKCFDYLIYSYYLQFHSPNIWKYYRLIYWVTSLPLISFVLFCCLIWKMQSFVNSGIHSYFAIFSIILLF